MLSTGWLFVILVIRLVGVVGSSALRLKNLAVTTNVNVNSEW